MRIEQILYTVRQNRTDLLRISCAFSPPGMKQPRIMTSRLYSPLQANIRVDATRSKTTPTKPFEPNLP
jgi:hypothetical protein